MLEHFMQKERLKVLKELGFQAHGEYNLRLLTPKDT